METCPVAHEACFAKLEWLTGTNRIRFSSSVFTSVTKSNIQSYWSILMYTYARIMPHANVVDRCAVTVVDCLSLIVISFTFYTQPSSPVSPPLSSITYSLLQCRRKLTFSMKCSVTTLLTTRARISVSKSCWDRERRTLLICRSAVKHGRTFALTCHHTSISVEVNAKIPDEGNQQNDLPLDTRLSLTADTFKRRLKTVLFE